MKRVLIAAAAVFMALPAFGQQSNCGPREAVLQVLARYGETRQSIGLAGSGSVVEMWANLETGTWTAVVTGTDGTSCIAVDGQGFELLSEELEPQGTKL